MDQRAAPKRIVSMAVYAPEEQRLVSTVRIEVASLRS